MKKKEDYTALLCDDCGEEIFVDVNMYMVHDELWSEIISKEKKLVHEDALCVDCMEKRLGRELTQDDWRLTDGEFALCNVMTFINRIGAHIRPGLRSSEP